MTPTILLVDDHQLYRATLTALVQMCRPEVRVFEAADSAQALGHLLHHRFDLILLDYQLPTLSGGDLIRHFRARADARGMTLPPVVLMSTQPDVACFARALGAATFLPKPVGPDELDEVLTTYLPLLSQPALPFGSTSRPGLTAAPPPAQTVTAAPLTTLPESRQSRRTTPLSSIDLKAAPVQPLPHSDERIAELRTQILQLFEQTIRDLPPQYVPFEPERGARRLNRIGDYLVHLGYLTPRQVARVMQIAEATSLEDRFPLGFTLVFYDLVPPRIVAAVLLRQFLDRLELNPTTAPRFLGEKLLVYTRLTPAQLAQALEEQLDSYKHSRWVRLGDLILLHAWLNPTAISTATSSHAELLQLMRLQT